MADSLAAPLAGVVLAAGAGARLAPLTRWRPKAMCPVGDRPLLDWSLDALAPAVGEVAVNTHHLASQISQHLARRVDSGAPEVHVSHEADVALGTAGAVGALRGWLDGRPALIVNGDTWHRADLAEFAHGWDGERIRLLTSSALPFGPRSGVVASLLPWSVAVGLAAESSGLWERVWRSALEEGRLEAVHEPGVVVDCATPADYLHANLGWSGGASVIGAGAVVEGHVTRSVVWPGERVERSEVLVDAIRAHGRTVLVR